MLNLLYKFRPINNYTISQFKNDELYVSKFTTFNDDQELVYYNNERKFKKHLIKFIKKLDFNTIIRNMNQDLTLEQLLNYLYKYSNDISLSLSENLYATCFTKEINCGAMWAHYASNNTGFALAYNFQDLVDKTNIYEHSRNVLMPVQYKNKKFNMTKDSIESAKSWIDFHLDEEKFLKNMEKELLKENRKPISIRQLKRNFRFYCRKSKNWNYENEWRIISIFAEPDEQNDYKLCFNIKPTAIYLSTNISEQDENILAEIAKEKNIPIFKMEKSMREKKIIYSVRNFFKKTA